MDKRLLNVPSRFWTHVDKRPDGCWIWTGHLSKNGYPEWWESKERPWARVIPWLWRLLGGSIARGQTILHSCTANSCVNPDHLFVGSHGQTCSSKLSPEERFWSRVLKTDSGCWEWQGARTAFGYGVFAFGKAIQRAHRISWVFSNGDIPDNLCVLHRCDNPPCVNPDHLFLGTKQDNTDDMIAKGRGVSPEERGSWSRGEKSGNALLTSKQVAIIKRRILNGERSVDIARDLGIAAHFVYNIKHKNSWTHVDPDFTNSN